MPIFGFLHGLFGGERSPHADSDLRDFLDGEPTFNMRASATAPGEPSRVRMAQYFAGAESLVVEYANGAVWKYDTITEGQATAFFKAASLGTWLWDNVRVRGKKNVHRVPAARVR